MSQLPVSGPAALLRGFRLLTVPGLRRFVLLPLLVNVALFVGAVAYALSWMERLSAWVTDHLPGWLDWLSWLLWPLFIISILLVVFYTFSLVANIIAAPFNGLLAEKVEVHLGGRLPEQTSDWRKLLKEFLPVMANELRKLLYMVLWSLPFLILFLIPGLNLFAPFLWFAFSAWMLALEYLDYPMGNHNINFRALRAELAKRRFLSLGFGSAVLVGTLIPVVNFFVMPAAVAGATVLWVEQFSAGRR